MGTDSGDTADVVDHVAMAEALDRFSATVTGDFSDEQVLRDLAEAATRVLRVDGAGVMVPSAEAGLACVFSTWDAGGRADALQEQLQDGPCLTARSSGQVVSVPDLRHDGQWPTFSAQAVDLGVRSVTAVPLHARGQDLGVLGLYRSAPGALEPEELAAARQLASLATSYLVMTADRDAARRAQDELAHRAMHDPLTGLPVRWVFLEQIDRALVRLRRHPGCVAVLFMDVDGLKYVNDTYGHRAGDRLLQACAQRARAALRPEDVLARIGGDEFVILLEDIADPDAAAGVARRVLEEIATPYRTDAEMLRLSASIGIAVTTEAGVTADAIISHADAAMYRAKRAGGGQYEMFDPTVYAADRADAAAREELIAELRTALAEDQLELHYQPIINLSVADDGLGPWPTSPAPHTFRDRLWAVEALLRWRHPTRGLLRAGSFIDVAERSGLMLQLGTWVIRTACRQLAAWDAELGTQAPQRMLLNVSPTELAQPDLPGTIADILLSTGIAGDRLTLEITETGLLTASATAAVEAVRELGCTIAIDDLGTGYSSLSRLVDVPAEVLKIDRSFTLGVPERRESVAVVAAILLLGHNLHRTVIIEGIEDDDTLTALRTLGCSHAQGFFLASPEPADAIADRLR